MEPVFCSVKQTGANRAISPAQMHNTITLIVKYEIMAYWCSTLISESLYIIWIIFENIFYSKQIITFDINNGILTFSTSYIVKEHGC